MLKAIGSLLRILDERPYFSSVSGAGRRFAVCGKTGKCRLFDSNLATLDLTDFGPGVRSLQFDETGSMLAVRFDDRLEFHSTLGSVERKFHLSVPGISRGAFLDEGRVFCAASCEQGPKLVAWDLSKGSVIDEIALPKHRGYIDYFIVPHPEGEAMAAVAYTGQSEEKMHWAHFSSGQLRVFGKPEIDDIAYPCFHPTGRELVSVHSRHGLCRVRFPSGERLGSIDPEEAFGSEDGFAFVMHFFREDRFLVWQECLALYEFDLATLRPTAKLLEGIDGKSYGENRFFSGESWKLADNRLLTSDTLHDRAFKDRIDTLRLWDASAHSRTDPLPLWDEPSRGLSGPDPTRPYTRELLALDR